jgi:hypothetical protein
MNIGELKQGRKRQLDVVTDRAVRIVSVILKVGESPERKAFCAKAELSMRSCAEGRRHARVLGRG